VAQVTKIESKSTKAEMERRSVSELYPRGLSSRTVQLRITNKEIQDTKMEKGVSIRGKLYPGGLSSRRVTPTSAFG